MARKEDDNSPRGNAIRANIAAQQAANRKRFRGHVDAADWKEADSVKLHNMVTAVSAHGHAIRLGYTKDGGAFAIGIIGDGEPTTHFVRPSEDIDLFMSECAAYYNERPAE